MVNKIQSIQSSRRLLHLHFNNEPQIYEEYATGLFSMDELVRKTKQWGLKNKNSEKYITKSQLAKILQNPFYYGVMFYNKTNYPHRYEKLISKELFDKCTEIRTALSKKLKHHYELKNQKTYYHLEKLKNELEELGEKQNKLLDLLLKGIINEDIYKQQITDITSKKN